MEPLSTGAIVGIAIKAVGDLIGLYRDTAPTYEQKLINKWDYLKDMYELERNKPLPDPAKSDKENANCRDNDLMLNLRDKLLRYGEQVTKELTAGKK